MTRGFPARILLAVIRVYQYLFSGLMGRSCRYHPTCSSYAAEAVRRYGALRGAWMGMCRIARCHPWNPGGYDPVPECDCVSADRPEQKEKKEGNGHENPAP